MCMPMQRNCRASRDCPAHPVTSGYWLVVEDVSLWHGGQRLHGLSNGRR